MKYGAVLTILMLATAGLHSEAWAGEANLVSVTQIGVANEVEVEQDDGGQARAEITQSGASNTGAIAQTGGAEAALLQQGVENVASLSQSDGAGWTRGWLYQAGDANTAALRQDGADNTAQMSQTGSLNTVELTQTGDGNDATLSQYGAGLALLVTQTGGATIAITQNSP